MPGEGLGERETAGRRGPRLLRSELRGGAGEESWGPRRRVSNPGHRARTLCSRQWGAMQGVQRGRYGQILEPMIPTRLHESFGPEGVSPSFGAGPGL